MYKIKFLILLFHIMLINLVSAADSDSENQDALTSRKLTFKVYRLKVHDISVGNFKSEDGSEYNSYPCQINGGCRWYSRPRSLTAPHYWQLVEEGTGCVIEQDRIDRNKGEHWLYFLPYEITGLKVSFAIVFGNGDFFKVSHYPGTEGGKGFFGIDESLGYSDFGSKVVRNIVGNPIVLAKTKGTLGGKPCYPYSKLFTYVKGIDFCSVEKRITSIRQFLDVCSNLETLYWQGEFELHSYFEEHIRTANLRRRDVSDKVNHEHSEEELEEIDDDFLKASDLLAAEESKRLVTFKEGDRQVTAYRVFDKYYTFDGLDQFLEETRTEVRKLCDHEALNLPAFNKPELRKYLPPEPEEQEGNGNKKKRIDWEGIYNANAARSTGYILLDKRLVRNVEVCDLLTAHLGHRFLIHVKIGTESSNLNHLFGQGYASACLMSQGEYPEEVFVKLVRERLFERASTILTDKFTEARLGLWDKFKVWRETHQNKKGVLDDIAESTIVEKIWGKINETSKTMIEAIETLESIKASEVADTQLILEQVVKSLKLALDSDDSSLFHVEKILRAKFSPKMGGREKLIWKSNDFPDKKEDFAEFCKALKDKKLQTKEDNSANKIASNLDKYRKDLLDDHIKKSFDKITGSLKTRKDEKNLRSFSTPKRRSAIDDEPDPNKKIRLILSALKEEYLKTKNKQLCDEQFKSIINDKISLNYFRQLYDYVLIPQKGSPDGQVLKVVFAIATDKTVEDPEFMPLGARINLIRTAKDIEKLNTSGKGIRFSPVVVAIKDTSPPPKVKNISQNRKKKKDKERMEFDDMNEPESSNRGEEPIVFQNTQMSEEASQLGEIRGPFQELAMANDEIPNQHTLKSKMLGFYIQLYNISKPQDIPTIIFAKIDANEKYMEMRKIAINMTESQIDQIPDFQRISFTTIRENANPLFSEKDLLDCITEEDEEKYLSRQALDIEMSLERNKGNHSTKKNEKGNIQNNVSKKRRSDNTQAELTSYKKKKGEPKLGNKKVKTSSNVIMNYFPRKNKSVTDSSQKNESDFDNSNIEIEEDTFQPPKFNNNINNVHENDSLENSHFDNLNIEKKESIIGLRIC